MLNRSVNACPRSSGSEGILPTQTASTDGGILVGPETDYSLSTTAARDAIRHRLQFNIIHVLTGLKLDLIQRKTTEFGPSEIVQGQRFYSDGHYDTCFDSPENVVLMKLRCFRDAGSEKHLREIARVIWIQGELIDQNTSQNGRQSCTSILSVTWYTNVSSNQDCEPSLSAIP